MIRHKTVSRAVWEAVWLAGNISVGKATNGAVWEAVELAVWGAVFRAVRDAVYGAVIEAKDRSHPHLEEFLRELRGEER